ncbi:receptor-like protein 7 [Vigna umbellata]|uniref:receptor-like protein 7 n=1 Tax=Vigna umbellata TaxID=87088 RepID=UPI001F5EFD69|nr:receptor-like protein 7 [Vigna umbellata]
MMVTSTPMMAGDDKMLVCCILAPGSLLARWLSNDVVVAHCRSGSQVAHFDEVVMTHGAPTMFNDCFIDLNKNIKGYQFYDPKLKISFETGITTFFEDIEFGGKNKQNLVFNPNTSNKLVHWNQSSDCCQWNGVTCSMGHVTGLDLSGESISGKLHNSTLFHLQYLLQLNLAYNDFNSSIPFKFDKLKNLRSLNLSNAGFHGQIPSQISQLTNLTTLDLSTSLVSQRFFKLQKPNISMFLQNLTKLSELYLDGVRVSAVGKEWCHALSSLQKLKVLSMSSCGITGPIDSSLATLKGLTVIRLNQNSVSSSVPEFFANFSNLNVLELSSCRLSGHFPKGILQIQTLNVLDISNNKDLHGALPNFQEDAVLLHTMNLSNTNFSGKLPSSISNLKQLSVLDLSNCQFIETLPISMSELTQLVYLDLSFNKFTGSLPSFTMVKNLRYLSLSHNRLNGTISTHFEGLENLLVINLGDNSLKGKIPVSLFTLPSLQELTLSHNGFNGPLDEFSNVSSSKLQLIDLSSNSLQGPFPVSLFHLEGLRFLQLSANEFSGTIALDRIQRLQTLHTLGLSHNNLSVDITLIDEHDISSFPNMKYLLLGSCNLRKIPGFLRNHPQLHALDLSNNQIHGIIPNWIWRFDSLVYLNLSNNFLTTMEGPFDDLHSKLYILDLHSNQLLGSIPTFTEYAVHLDYSSNNFSTSPLDLENYIPFVHFLSLSNNNFQGKIHEAFCNFSYLRLLDLSYNSFNGFIPKCLMTRNSTLRVLNLARNKLQGFLSDTISSSCNLRFLNLNENLLGGAIPNSLANCQSLQVLNLGNNLFSDRFPCFLRNISTLRVLILRSNKLNGSISCPHSTTNWEMLHIVDLSYNNFTGTLPGALLRSWTKMIGNQTESQEEQGTLYFDMFDNHDNMRYNNLFSVISQFLVIKLYKLLSTEPYTVADHIFAYYVTSNQFGGRYLDSVTIVSRAQQKQWNKIPSALTSLDLSWNHFQGPIPQELSYLTALYALNLSHNGFSSNIPSSIGNLRNLESMDLSNNRLGGEIPVELLNLNFLAYLNLSFNHLRGRIPSGGQMYTFEASSFKGNEGLCGPPLKDCSNGRVGDPLPTPVYEMHGSIEINFLSVELGFIFGFGIFILPLMLLKSWRLLYWQTVDNFLQRVVPQLDFVYDHYEGKRYKSLRWMG